MNRRLFATTLAAALAAGPALADHHSGDHSDKQQTRDFDASLAEALAFGNQAEIAVSELAKDRVQTPQVRDFAQTMVQEHTKVLNRLEEFAPELTDIRRVSVESGDNPTASAKNKNAHSSMEQIWTEAAARCLNKTLEGMKAEQGLDFDWAYVNQQCFAHTKMLSELEAMRGQGSEEFNQIVEDAVAATKKHKQKLDSLMTILERREG